VEFSGDISAKFAQISKIISPVNSASECFYVGQDGRNQFREPKVGYLSHSPRKHSNLHNCENWSSKVGEQLLCFSA